jgi:hypothetical protein
MPEVIGEASYEASQPQTPYPGRQFFSINLANEPGGALPYMRFL